MPKPRGLLALKDAPERRGLLETEVEPNEFEPMNILPFVFSRRTGEARFDPTAGLLGAVLSAVTLPRDVMSGKVRVDPDNPEFIGRTLDFAGLLTGGGFAGAFGRTGLGAGGGRLATGSFELPYFGQSVRILQNPSPQRMEGFLRRTRHGAARRITEPDTGDVYVWDAADPALHQLVAEQLGVRPDAKLFDMVGLD